MSRNNDPITLDQLKDFGFNLENLIAKIEKARKMKPKAGDHVLNTADTRTIENLQNVQWSGIRDNALWNRFEIWILGEIRATVTYAEVFLNTRRLEKAYMEVFGLDEINMDAKTARDLRRLEERKEMLSAPEVQRVISQLTDPTIDARATTNPERMKGNAGKPDEKN